MLCMQFRVAEKCEVQSVAFAVLSVSKCVFDTEHERCEMN